MGLEFTTPLDARPGVIASLLKRSDADLVASEPARRMYEACGFREVRRIPWDREPGRMVIEYEKDAGL